MVVDNQHDRTETQTAQFIILWVFDPRQSKSRYLESSISRFALSFQDSHPQYSVLVSYSRSLHYFDLLPPFPPDFPWLEISIPEEDVRDFAKEIVQKAAATGVVDALRRLWNRSSNNDDRNEADEPPAPPSPEEQASDGNDIESDLVINNPDHVVFQFPDGTLIAVTRAEKITYYPGSRSGALD
jgi:hypothetical protein